MPSPSEDQDDGAQLGDRRVAAQVALRAAARRLAQEEPRTARKNDGVADASGSPSSPPDESTAPMETMSDVPRESRKSSMALQVQLNLNRDSRDRWLVLKSLEGRRVTVLAGFKYLRSHTGTLTISRNRQDWLPGSSPQSIIIDDGRKQRWFPIRDVHSVTDPLDGLQLGGPW